METISDSALPGVIPKISRLTLRNFKTFDQAEVELTNLTVFIGPNASGKSNLLSVLSFLKDVTRYGLDDAVSIQGGIDAVRCLYVPRTEPVAIGVRIELPGPLPYFQLLRHTGQAGVTPRTRYRDAVVDYRFEFVAAQRTRRLRVIAESLTIDFSYAFQPRLTPQERRKQPSRESLAWHRGKLTLRNKEGSLTTRFEDGGAGLLQVNEFRFEELKEESRDQREPLIRRRALLLAFDGFSILSNVFKYDVDPKLGKNAIPVTGRTELEEDGDNLASALRAILVKKVDRVALVSLVTDALSFVKNVDVATFADMTRFLKIKERYNPRQTIPGSLLSDGTVSVLTLIIALYFQSSLLTIFEEPDRGLHPALARKIAVMMQEQSATRQIIVSTHSPDFIDAVDSDVVQCTLRDDMGYTQLFKPSESERVKEFTEVMGIGRVYADNLIGV